jgi:hypothetical protein
MEEAYSESLERKRLEQRIAEMMDEHIGLTVCQYAQQAPSYSKQNSFYKPAVTQAQDQGNASQNLITHSSQMTAGSSSYFFLDKYHLTRCFRGTTPPLHLPKPQSYRTRNHKNNLSALRS